MNLLLLLDISGSMQQNIELISETARQALDASAAGRPRGHHGVREASEMHQDFSDNLAETARQISRAVKDHDVGNTTQINTAVVDAAHYMQAHAGPVRQPRDPDPHRQPQHELSTYRWTSDPRA